MPASKVKQSVPRLFSLRYVQLSRWNLRTFFGTHTSLTSHVSGHVEFFRKRPESQHCLLDTSQLLNNCRKYVITPKKKLAHHSKSRSHDWYILQAFVTSWKRCTCINIGHLSVCSQTAGKCDTSQVIVSVCLLIKSILVVAFPRLCYS